MKTKILLLILLYPIFIFGQTWDYPIKPGMEEWKRLNSHQEMVDICQIPDNVISKIPTENLVELCLNYPLFFTMKAFNNLQDGFNQVSTEFNGFQELFKREDVGTVLLAIYAKTKPADVQKEKDLISKGLFEQRLFFIEFILAQRTVIEKMTESEIKSLLKETILKTEEKAKLEFSTFNKQATSLIAVRILGSEKVVKNNIKNFDIQRYKAFSETVWLTDKNMIKDIHAESINYLNTVK